MEIDTDREIQFAWDANHDNGDIVSQFVDGREVNHFGHVDLKNVNTFTLTSRTLNPQITYSVDLTTGLFYRDDQRLEHVGNLENKPLKSRVGDIEISRGKLIFFRRVKRMFTPGSPVSQVEINYWLGWEAIIDGEVHKHMIEIDEQGNFKIAESGSDGFKPL